MSEHDQLRLPGDFNPLLDAGLDAEQVYRETLATTFNAPSGGTLRVERLKGSAGELALRVGETNEPFGVVNVGDPAKLAKKCEEAGLIVREREFADSVFHSVNEPDSRINVVVGAKKFTEGWNSWRVSSMGLMNVGKSEGSQIIQLFGRGVRLKGRGMSLKRSSADRSGGAERRPTHLGRLETLHVFGVRAGYMAQFRDFLKEEGLAVDSVEEFIPIRVPELPSGLKVIRVAESVAGGDPAGAFRRSGPRFALRAPWDEELPEAVRTPTRHAAGAAGLASKSANDPVEGAGRVGRRPGGPERGDAPFPSSGPGRRGHALPVAAAVQEGARMARPRHRQIGCERAPARQRPAIGTG